MPGLTQGWRGARRRIDDPQHVRDINATCSNLEALPEFRRDPEAPRPAPDLSWPAVPASKAAINADLEALLAITLTSAQDAWHIARQAHEASRKARCGMFVAVGVAAIGVMVAAGAIVAALRCGDANPAGGGNRQAGAAPWRSASGESRRNWRTPGHSVPSQEASAAPARPDAALPSPGESGLPALAPLKTKAVRVLPAMPAAPSSAANPPDQAANTGLRPIEQASSTGLRPVRIFISSVQRDVGLLLR